MAPSSPWPRGIRTGSMPSSACRVKSKPAAAKKFIEAWRSRWLISWWFPGDFMVILWWFPGDFMVILWWFMLILWWFLWLYIHRGIQIFNQSWINLFGDSRIVYESPFIVIDVSSWPSWLFMILYGCKQSFMMVSCTYGPSMIHCGYWVVLCCSSFGHHVILAGYIWIQVWGTFLSPCSVHIRFQSFFIAIVFLETPRVECWPCVIFELPGELNSDLCSCNLMSLMFIMFIGIQKSNLILLWSHGGMILWFCFESNLFSVLFVMWFVDFDSNWLFPLEGASGKSMRGHSQASVGSQWFIEACRAEMVSAAHQSP